MIVVAKKIQKFPSTLTGMAGEYAVAAELCRRGYIASITLKNAQSIDILVSNLSATKTAAIQVKTMSKKTNHWLLNKKSEKIFSKRLFYVFVNLSSELSRYPRFYIVPSKLVAKYISSSHKRWLSKSTRAGKQRKDSDMRVFKDLEDKLLDRWDLLDLD